VDGKENENENETGFNEKEKKNCFNEKEKKNKFRTRNLFFPYTNSDHKPNCLTSCT
jgi:hypothetical protein